tara:strand:- start:1765 stop:2604 length:840 start_codon:yes stop_codon:yes gene_type:complete
LKNILALGTAACSIVEGLKKYKVYNIYKISNNTNKAETSFKIPELETAEQYENLEVASKISFLKKIKEEVTFFVSGASKSSALSLRILEFLHKKQVAIKVVYFKPEVDFLSEEQFMQERLTRGVLQEYARSGLFQEITLICTKTIESLIESINVMDYYGQINTVFCDTYHMIEVFKNTKPVMSTFSKLRESCRIKTIGVSSVSCEDKVLYPFKQEVEVVYYYGINEDKLKEQGDLFRALATSVKGRMNSETKAYFGIYPTKYEHDYVYVEYYSPKTQQT